MAIAKLRFRDISWNSQNNTQMNIGPTFFLDFNGSKVAYNVNDITNSFLMKSFFIIDFLILIKTAGKGVAYNFCS